VADEDEVRIVRPRWACHADWVAKSIDELRAHYQKLQTEDN